jgi:serine/threonine protein kinase
MIGHTIHNRYKITSLLGEGGMGEVYLATDEQTGQQVAVKILAIHLRANSEMLERFHREAKTLRQLDHPNIVKFVEAFEHYGQFVIVMEYVSGGSLHDLLKKGPLPIERARKIALGLCDALIRSHQLNIIHRDIKPENVLLAEDGSPKLTDFGVARLSEGTRMTRSGTQVGTPHYMAPEAWEGKTLDEQADIWSLGVILFEMLTGQVPFGGDTPLAVMSRVHSASLPDMRRLRPDVPTNLIKITRRMVTRDTLKRYQIMREVALDLEREPSAKARKSVVGDPAVSTASKRFLPNSRLVWLVLGGSVIVVAVAANLFGSTNPLSLAAALTPSPVSTTTSSLEGEVTNLPTATATRSPTQTLSPTPTPIFLEGEVLFEKDFEDNSLNGLKVTLGSLRNWTVVQDENNRVLQADPMQNESVMISSLSQTFDNYLLEFDVKFITSSPSGMEIWLRNDGVCDAYHIGLGEFLFFIRSTACGNASHLTDAKTFTIRNDVWYSMTTILFQDEISIFVDQRLMHNIVNIEYSSGAFAFEVSKDNIVYLDNIKVTDLLPR